MQRFCGRRVTAREMRKKSATDADFLAPAAPAVESVYKGYSSGSSTKQGPRLVSIVRHMCCLSPRDWAARRTVATRFIGP